MELETLDRAMPSVSAISSAVIGASARYSRPWIWLTERLTPHSSPMSPQCRMNRSTAAGSFFLSVVSVITEISDITAWKSSAIGRCPGIRPETIILKPLPAAPSAQMCLKLVRQEEPIGAPRVSAHCRGRDVRKRQAQSAGSVRERTQFPASGRCCHRLRAVHARPDRHRHQLEYRRPAYQGLFAQGDPGPELLLLLQRNRPSERQAAARAAHCARNRPL